MATPPDFSPGQVLTAAHMDAVGLWLVKSQTIGSAVSSETVTDAFSADFDAYKIVVTGGVASGICNLRLNFDGNTAGYYSSAVFVAYSAGLGNASGIGGNNLGYFDRVGYGSTSVLTANIEVLDPFAAKKSSYAATFGATTTGASSLFSAGFHDSATSFTGFRIATSSGTMTGGTIRVYGYRN